MHLFLWGTLSACRVEIPLDVWGSSAAPVSATYRTLTRREYRSGEPRSRATMALPMVFTQTLQRAVPGLTNRKRRNKPNVAELRWNQRLLRMKNAVGAGGQDLSIPVSLRRILPASQDGRCLNPVAAWHTGRLPRTQQSYGSGKSLLAHQDAGGAADSDSSSLSMKKRPQVPSSARCWQTHGIPLPAESRHIH